MSDHNLFYYPYASFTNAQLPLLKVAALYFDKLYILDPDKASGGTIGLGEDEQVEKDVRLLEKERILERISPEEVLQEYEQAIGDTIKEDLNSPEFLQLCETAGKAEVWTLALAKVPKEIRDDPQHAEHSRLKPRDQAMQRLMGELPRQLSDSAMRYQEGYAEAAQRLSGEQVVYDEQRRSRGRDIEYRFADYPLPLGESIMMNHALFGGLLHTSATPLTDDPFHNHVLNLKLHRARQSPAIRNVLEDRARIRQLKADHLAASGLTDRQLDLPVLNPQLSLEEVLEYRHQHEAVLGQARHELGWMARRIEAEPWSKDFARELEHSTIPDLAGKLEDVRKARDSWLKSKRDRLALKAAGLGIGAAAAVLSVFTAPVTPIALTIASLGLASGTVIPGAEWILDWRDGKHTAHENGLHYLLMV